MKFGEINSVNIFCKFNFLPRNKITNALCYHTIVTLSQYLLHSSLICIGNRKRRPWEEIEKELWEDKR
jgi:hypothetical protein